MKIFKDGKSIELEMQEPITKGIFKKDFTIKGKDLCDILDYFKVKDDYHITINDGFKQNGNSFYKITVEIITE